jgi:hypothetical protein
MYPASGLDFDPGYAVEDLPETVSVTLASGTYEMERQPDGSYVGEGGNVVLFTDDAESWTIESTYEGDDTVNIGACLITGDGGFIADGDTVEDQFEATYTTDLSSFSDPGVHPLTRTGLCSWTYTKVGGLGFPINIQIIGWDETVCKWRLYIFGTFSPFRPSGNYFHDGPQTSPAGTYTYESGSGTINVT